MKNSRDIFSDNLRDLISEAGLTHRAFAEIMGVSEATVHKWTDGTSLARAEHLDDICDYFKISPSALFAGPGALLKPTKEDQIRSAISLLADSVGLKVIKKTSKKKTS